MATPSATAVAAKAQDNSHRAPMCCTPCVRSVVLSTGHDETSGREDVITMVQRALLVDRPRSERGLTMALLMLLATLVAIGVIAFAAVHSGQSASALGTAQQSAVGQLAATG